MTDTTQELKTSYYISVSRVGNTMLVDDDFTGNSIKIKGESFLELLSGKRRHKLRSLFNFETNERILIVK